MNGKYFLDTNILVYTFDSRVPAKRERARDLVDNALRGGRGAISWQVVQEFLNVATRKFETPLAPADCALYLDGVLGPLCEVFPSMELYQRALQIQESAAYSFYDALIVAAAVEGGCKVLYTEDLQAGRTVGGLSIRNPFLGLKEPAKHKPKTRKRQR